MSFFTKNSVVNFYSPTLFIIQPLKKQKLREEIIYGTLYVIYRKLKNSIILNFKTPSYDINDIIQTSTSYWIDIIDNGKLLGDIKFTSRLLYPSQLLRSLGNNLNDTNTENLISYDTFNDLFTWFFEQKNKGLDVKYSYFEDYAKIFVKNKKLNTNSFIYLYNVLNDFCDYCLKNDVKISDKKYLDRYLREFYVEIGNKFRRENIKNIKINENDEMFEKFRQDQFNGCIMDFINEHPYLTDKERIVILMRYGLKDGKFYTCDKVGQYLNITRGRVGAIEAKALRKLKGFARSKSRLDPHYKTISKLRSYTQYNND